MTAPEFRDLLDQMGLKQLTVARFIGVDGRQVRRWVSGEAPVPVVVEILLTYMAAKGLTPAQVLEACEIDRPLDLI